MITVRFNCPQCGLIKHAVQVPAREHDQVDVVWWMKEVVTRAVASEHNRVSPQCRATTIEELIIPIENCEFIGQQIE